MELKDTDYPNCLGTHNAFVFKQNTIPWDKGPWSGGLVRCFRAGGTPICRYKECKAHSHQSWQNPVSKSPGPSTLPGTAATLQSDRHGQHWGSKQGEALHERQEHIKRALLKRDLHYLADCNPAPDVDYSGADESWGQLWPSRGTPAPELPAKNTSTCELQCCFLPHKGIAVYLFHWEHGHTPHIPSRKQHPMKFMAKVCFSATL